MLLGVFIAVAVVGFIIYFVVVVQLRLKRKRERDRAKELEGYH